MKKKEINLLNLDRIKKNLRSFEKTIEIAQDIATVLFHAQKGNIKQREIITYPMMISA